MARRNHTGMHGFTKRLMTRGIVWFLLVGVGCAVWCPSETYGQALGQPDRGAPADERVQSFLAKRAIRFDGAFDVDLTSLAVWSQNRERYHREYLDMLGLDPLPTHSPLGSRVTGTLDQGDYLVENVAFQSVPGLYVTGNLYRPPRTGTPERYPAVLYVCGHSGMGRDGNKTAFQTHGIWFARHGYVCLVIDTLQLGEIAGKHHGTYNLERWWWQSRGYTSAGVECWNGIRSIDYLQSRDDVDGERIGVTGISGGGAATFWIAAADPRVRVAVPVSGMADLNAYVGNRVINGHCDCMFLYNHHTWPWTRIAGLIAPRPMLFVNSDQDAIFPMDANERISNRLERLYSLYAAGDRFETMVSVGGHAYREDIRRAVFAFMNRHLRGDASEVTDADDGLPENGDLRKHLPIAPERLRVFPTDADVPADARNAEVDTYFVPAKRSALKAGASEAEHREWRDALLARLRQVPFQSLNGWQPIASVAARKPNGERTLRDSDGLEFKVIVEKSNDATRLNEVWIVVDDEVPEDKQAKEGVAWWHEHVAKGSAVWRCQPRGTGEWKWTRRNPPNYVERSYVLLGETVDSARVRDVIGAALTLKQEMVPSVFKEVEVGIVGKGRGAVLAAYAAALMPEAFQRVVLIEPPTTHQDPASPAFLSVMRTCDIPDVVATIAPRPLKIIGRAEDWKSIRPAYEATGAIDQLTITE